MPGDDLDAALKAAAEFKAQGVGSLLTRLGENVNNLSEAGEVVRSLRGRLCEGVRRRP